MMSKQSSLNGNAKLIDIMKQNGVRHGLVFKNLFEKYSKPDESQEIDFDLLDNENDVDLDFCSSKKLIKFNKLEKLLPFTSSTPISSKTIRTTSRTILSSSSKYNILQNNQQLSPVKEVCEGRLKENKENKLQKKPNCDPLKRLFFNQQQNDLKIRIAEVKSCSKVDERFQIDLLRNFLASKQSLVKQREVKSTRTKSTTKRDLLKEFISQKHI